MPGQGCHTTEQGGSGVARHPLSFRSPLPVPAVLMSYVTAILWNEVFLGQRKDFIPLIDFGTHSIADVKLKIISEISSSYFMPL